MCKEGQIRMRKTAFMLSLGAICVCILSGCKSKSKYKVPTTPMEKVTVALNGVQSSFSNYKSTEKTSNSSKTRAASRIAQSDAKGALDDISALYTSYDSQGDKIDDLEYDQPPMIQFQCIKKVFEKIGSSFSFGTKYSDVINGTCFFNPETGEKVNGDENYKYNYTFDLSLALNIDSNDLINADVSFKINLTKGEENLETKWYVAMVLDYDMEKESPTYTLSMYTDNQESALKYLEYGSTYEYDFVDMKDGRINEWRKFCYEVNKQMIKDTNHPNFASYVNEPDFKAQIGASKWYKKADLRKISHPNTSKTRKFAGALFDKFGLNSTDINSTAFTSKQGVQNSVIKTVYQEFSQIFGQDVIYALITGSEGHNNAQIKASMHVMDEDVHQIIDQIHLTEDTTLRTLFSGEEGNNCIWYFDENDEALEQIEDLDTVNFELTIFYGSNRLVLNSSVDNTLLDTDISEIFKENLNKEQFASRHEYAELYIMDVSCHTNVSISIGEAIIEDIRLYYRKIFPQEILDLGFPRYAPEDGECLYDFTNETQKKLDVSNTNAEQLEAFKSSLVSETGKWSRLNDNRYTKLIGTKLYGIEIQTNEIDAGKVSIFYTIKDVTLDVWPTDILAVSNNIFDIEAPETLNGYFTVPTDPGQEHTVIINNITEEEKSDFVDALIEGMDAVVISAGGKINSIIVRDNNQLFKFKFMVGENDITFCYEPFLSYHYYQLTLVNPDDDTFGAQFSVNTDYSGYALKQYTLQPGNYKIKVDDLFTSESGFFSMRFEEGTLNDNVQYDEDERLLTLVEETKVTITCSLVDVHDGAQALVTVIPIERR